jgi:hypothetical protein
MFLEIITNPVSKLIVPYLDPTLHRNSTPVSKHVCITVTIRMVHTINEQPPSSPINPSKNACFNNLHFSQGLYTLHVLRIFPQDKLTLL